jgi:DSF synthase
VVTVQALASAHQYKQIDTDYDPEHGIVWSYMKPHPRPCFSMDLLKELLHHEANIERSHGTVVHDDQLKPVNYVVFASKVPGIFNLGGDLERFAKAFRNGDREALTTYATACVKGLHRRYVAYDLPLTTISLVQGKALGGGFECALGSNVLIAERSAEMGLPEVTFNLFPGMGAWSFLSRKVGPKIAKEMIMSGRIYRGPELHELGVVDVLAEDGAGEAAVYDYVNSRRRVRNTTLSMQRVQQLANPITLEELTEVTKVWVDSVFSLTERDVQMMEKLVQRQQKFVTRGPTHVAQERAVGGN